MTDLSRVFFGLMLAAALLFVAGMVFAGFTFGQECHF